MGRGRLCARLSIVALCLTACDSGTAGGANDPRRGQAPDVAVARVVASLGDPIVQGADVVAHPNPTYCNSPCIRVRLDSDRGRGVREVWLGELVLGAIGELVRTDQKNLAAVVSGQIVDRTPNQRVHTIQLGGDGRVGQQFDSPPDDDLRQRVATIAARYGLSVKSVEILHPLDSALAVTFTVPPGDVAWTIDGLSHELEGSPTDVEGVCIELDSPTGRPLVRFAHRERLAGGGGWFAAGQADRFGFVNHG
jgi:hypothetical protein